MILFTNKFIKDLFWSGIFIIFYYFLTHNSLTYPIPKISIGLWSIEKLQRPLVFRLAGHNYFALRNSKGEIVSELHGLATNAETNKWTYVGTGNGELLKVWEFSTSIFGETNTILPGIVINKGDEKSVRLLWEKARVCGNLINQKNIPYPPFGVKMYETENSNAVAYTLAKCMGIETKRIGIIIPGEKTDLLTK